MRNKPGGLKASLVIVNGFELSLGDACKDGQLVKGTPITCVNVARFLVVLTSSSVVGRILKFRVKLIKIFAIDRDQKIET